MWFNSNSQSLRNTSHNLFPSFKGSESQVQGKMILDVSDFFFNTIVFVRFIGKKWPSKSECLQKTKTENNVEKKKKS